MIEIIDSANLLLNTDFAVSSEYPYSFAHFQNDYDLSEPWVRPEWLGVFATINEAAPFAYSQFHLAADKTIRSIYFQPRASYVGRDATYQFKIGSNSDLHANKVVYDYDTQSEVVLGTTGRWIKISDSSLAEIGLTGDSFSLHETEEHYLNYDEVMAFEGEFVQSDYLSTS